MTGAMTGAMIGRRALILSGTALVAAPWTAARATPADVATAVRELTGGAALQPGRVKLDVPVMVENGNAVGLTVGVDEVLPPEQRVVSLHVFAEGNPLPHVLNAYFGPASGRPRVATRIRLATSQTVVAVARLADGTWWTDGVDLIVVQAACLE